MSKWIPDIPVEYRAVRRGDLVGIIRYYPAASKRVMSMRIFPRIKKENKIASSFIVTNSKICFFLEKFSRNRFPQIFWMLLLKKLARSDGTIRTRIQKASDYVEYVDSKFRQSFVPDKAIVFNESVVTFKGRISFIT
jgi:hypothetical protein